MADTDTDSNDGSIGTLGENIGDLKSALDTNIHNFAIDFENIIKILQGMIIDARNKTLDASVGDFTNEGDGPFSESGENTIGTPVNTTGSNPGTPTGNTGTPTGPTGTPTGNTGTPSGNTGTPTGPTGTPTGNTGIPSAPLFTPEPDTGPSTRAIPVGDQFNLVGGPRNLVPDNLNSNLDPLDPAILDKTFEDLQARLHILNKLDSDTTQSPSENSEKLRLVDEIKELLAQHLNLIRQFSKTRELDYAYSLFMAMLINSNSGIDTTHNRKIGNIMVKQTPNMESINKRLSLVKIPVLEELKGLLDEFKEDTDNIKQREILLEIYNISRKISFFVRLNGVETLPQPVLIQPQSITTDTTTNNNNNNDINSLKQQLLDIINTNITQLQELVVTINEKMYELVEILAEKIDNNVEFSSSNIFKEAVSNEDDLDRMNGYCTNEIIGQNTLKQRINDENMTEDQLKEHITTQKTRVSNYTSTITSTLNNTNRIIIELNRFTNQQSPDSFMGSSTDSLGYSTTSSGVSNFDGNSPGNSPGNSSFDTSSLIGLKFVNQSEYNGEIQRISNKIKELQNQVTNPSYGNNIFKVLDDILNMLSEISSKESTLLTTEQNKKYMNDILLQLSSIVKLIDFCKLYDKPGYCDTINGIPSNIPNTDIDLVTSKTVNTKLPEIYTYVTQILNNIVSNVKKEAQSYITTLDSLSNQGVSSEITKQINEVMTKIITFMEGGIIRDIGEVDNNVLPDRDNFIVIIGNLRELLTNVLKFDDNPSIDVIVHDIQFYLLKTVTDMLHCMFINSDNQQDCAIANTRGKIKVEPGPIQDKISKVNEIITKYKSNVTLNNIENLRDELFNLFPGVTVPPLQNGRPFIFDSNEYDESPIHDESLDNLSVGNDNISSSQMLDLSQSRNDTIPSRMSDISDISNISNISNQSINNSQMSNLRNSENSIKTQENSIGLHDSLSTIGSLTSTDTTGEKINGKETTQEDFDIDNANINNNLKQSIDATINKFTELNNKLNSKNNTTANNGYIFMNSKETFSTTNIGSTTSQIIESVTKNNEYFVKLLQLLQNSLTADTLKSESSITKILNEINKLISSTNDDRFNYTDYNNKLVELYKQLRELMTTTLGINITDNTTYPQRLTGGGINDKIRFTYKNKRGTKRAKKSRPTKRRKYTPHKKNYYY